MVVKIRNFRHILFSHMCIIVYIHFICVVIYFNLKNIYVKFIKVHMHWQRKCIFNLKCHNIPYLACFIKRGMSSNVNNIT